MNIKPLHKNIIVERKAAEKVSPTGIILSGSDEPDKAVVVAVSDSVTEVVVGEELLVNWNAAYKLENEQYKIDIDNVVAVFG